ncbi:hypothetical protein GGF37_002214 [Kickxella alabastrina]|nr:hypothetical protein GGF37_002214 [Kickxella alabastrina]
MTQLLHGQSQQNLSESTATPKMLPEISPEILPKTKSKPKHMRKDHCAPASLHKKQRDD